MGTWIRGFRISYIYQIWKRIKDIDTVLINAVECEPYLTSDYKIMEKTCKKSFADGTHLPMKAGHAKKGAIAIKVK